MADPSKMVRTDGTKVVQPTHPSWKTEFISLFVALKEDPWILLLFPMFFASNYFYTWRQCFSLHSSSLSYCLKLIRNMNRIQRLQRSTLYHSCAWIEQSRVLDGSDLWFALHRLLHS